MDRYYSHCDTEHVGRPFVHTEFGQRESLVLGDGSGKIVISFPVRSNNLIARLTLPTDARIVLPKEDPLFSLETLTGQEGQTYIFQTNYFDFSPYIHDGGFFIRDIKASPVRQQYIAKEIGTMVHSIDGDAELDAVSDGFKSVVRDILGKQQAETWQDVLLFSKYALDHIKVWEHGRGKRASEILSELKTDGVYEGNCTEQETLTRLLLSVGGIKNRPATGVVSSEEGVLNGEFHKARYPDGHAWNEFQISDGENTFWVPLDWANIPYLRKDSLMIFYVHGHLPRVEGATAKCTLQIDEMDL